MHLVITEISATVGALIVMLLLILGAGALFARALRFPGFVEAAAIERAGIAGTREALASIRLVPRKAA
jgi:hypothetical protein